MSERRVGFLGKIAGTLRSPRKTFGSVSEKDLGRSFVLVLLMATISAWAGYNYASKMRIEFPSAIATQGMSVNPEAFRANVVAFMSLLSGSRVLLSWLVTSLLLHPAASLISGRGSMKRLLALTGFASIPLVIQHLIRLVDSYTIPSELLNTSVRAAGRISNIRIVDEALGVFTIFGLWTFILTAVAVSTNYRSSMKRALMATSIAYLAYILIRLFIPI